MKELVGHVARWPLLLGAILCIGGSLVIAIEAGAGELVVGVLLAIGALLLGAWLWALATHTNPASRSGDSGEEGSVVDGDVHLGGGDGSVAE